MLALPALCQTPPVFSVTNYRLVKEEQRVSRTISDFEYRVDLVNTGPLRNWVTATLTSKVPSVQVLQGTVNFITVPANSQVPSSDTFTIRVDRSVPFDLANLEWSFSADNAPLANPGPNLTVTLLTNVILNGSNSLTPPGTGPLSYQWAFVSRPAGSNAALANPTQVTTSFLVDVAGTYVVRLTVSNNFAGSQGTVSISTTNSAPVANAGPNQSAGLGATVQLNGSGSSDVDGDPLTYAWTLTQRPTGSAASLTGATLVNPTFKVDKPGTYLAQLVVHDGKASSSASTVRISTQNSAPVANPGAAQSVNVGATVQLNGAGSTDVDGDSLTYQWSINSLPQGSNAALSSATAVNPTFTADRPGTYVVQLIVDDGKLKSTPATVTISTNAVQGPTANAGQNQTVKHGVQVTLSGSGTDPQSLPLTYQWSFTTKPTGSTADFSSPTAASPVFTADKPGTYVAQLIVNNGFTNSTPATVTITTTNTAPVANAGADQNATAGNVVNLNGGASSDADGDAITHAWSFTTRPAGSAAVLSAASSATPTFVADLAGTYVVQLIVNDGFTNSNPVTATITVSNRGNIVLPANAPAGLGQTAAYSVTLSAPAPAGGVTVTLVPADAARVSLSAVSLFIPQDATAPATQPQITGLTLGSVNISASAPGYTAATQAVKVTASLSFNPASLSIDGVATKNLSLVLSAPAPAGGIVVNLNSNNTAAATVPATVTIPQAATSVNVPVTSVAPGSAVIRATGTDLVEASANITVNRVDIIVPTTLSVAPGEIADFPVTLAKPSVGSTFVSLVSSDTSKVTVSVQNVLFNDGQTQPTARPKVTGVSTGAATISATATGLNPAVSNVQVGLGLSFPQPTLTILGSATENLILALSGPAPQSGLTVALSSSNTGVAVVPQTIAFGATTTSVSVPVTAVAPGTATIRASATGAGEATATVTVSAGTGSIVLPASTTIAQGQTAAFAVSLSSPAAAGGATIALTSSDPSKVTIAPTTVTIAAGQTQPATQPQVTGAAAGTSAINATAPGYAAVSRNVQVNAVPTQILAFSGSPQSATTGAAFAAPLIVSVKDSSGAGVPGITVTFSAPAGGAGGTFENGVNTAITNAAGFATSAAFRANSIAGSYSVTASVNGLGATAAFSLTNTAPSGGGGGQGAISLTGASVGQNLQTAISLSLPQPAGVGGVRVDISSGDPVKLLIAGRPTDLGSAQITVTVGEGLSTISGIYVQGLVSSGTVNVTAAASGFSSGTAAISLTPSGFVLTGPGGSGVPNFSLGHGSSATITVSAARLDSGLRFVETQPVRGGFPATVPLSSSVAAIGGVAPAQVTIAGGDTAASATFDANGSSVGDTVIAAAVPAGFSRPALGADSLTANVVAATLITSALTLGENLQGATSIRLNSPAPTGGMNVTVTSGDPSKLLFANSATGAGSSSITIVIPAGRSASGDFFAQALANSGSVAYTAAAQGFGSATGTVTLSRSGFVLGGPFGIGTDFFTTTGAENTDLTITPARLDGSFNFVEAQPIRGGLTVDVPLAVTNPSVGTVQGAPVRLTGGSLTGTVQFKPVTTGSTAIGVTAPVGFTIPSRGGSLMATVKAPGLVIDDGTTIGRNLQAVGSILIGQLAPAGGLAVTLTSNSPDLLLSPSESASGSSSITITIPAGQSSAFYTMQARGSSGVATYTATAPGYAARTATVKLAPSGVVIAGPFGFGFPLVAKVTGGPQTAFAFTALLDPLTNAYVMTQNLSAGLTLDVALTNSDPAIGTVPQTVTIAGGTGSSPFTFQPLASGSTTIAVTPPAGYTTPASATTLSALVND